MRNVELKILWVVSLYCTKESVGTDLPTVSFSCDSADISLSLKRAYRKLVTTARAIHLISQPATYRLARVVQSAVFKKKGAVRTAIWVPLDRD